MPTNALNSLKKADTKRWDKYFHNLCKTVATKSPCLSRKIGALLVRDKSVISMGFNGPPRGIPHCGHERWLADEALRNAAKHCSNPLILTKFRNTCPRQVLGYKSGTHMELCPAQHAEENAISNAARLGVSVIGSTLYMNCVVPCKNCYGTLINSGIIEIVVNEVKVYDKFTQFLIDNSNIKIRKFNL
jgi:dCMP deaminase